MAWTTAPSGALAWTGTSVIRRFVLRGKVAIDQAVEALTELYPSVEAGEFDHPKWEVEIRPYQKKRTPAQNRTIHMWIGQMASHTGATAEDMKDWLKFASGFWPQRQLTVGFETKDIPKSTTQLTAEEMMEVMTHVQAHCAEWGIPITDPIPGEMRELMELVDRERADAEAARH